MISMARSHKNSWTFSKRGWLSYLTKFQFFQANERVAFKFDRSPIFQPNVLGLSALHRRSSRCFIACGLKFIYYEKATKFCKLSTNYLSNVVPVKSKGKISQNFVAFSEYMNFTTDASRTRAYDPTALHHTLL